MAKKRMFSLSVVDTDLFLEMPVTSRLLYYELGMRADDDGFVDNWKKIMRMASLTEDDMKVLIAKKFILPFESGVIVIRHWRLNNYLRNDRHIPTVYQNEYKALHIENDIYELENAEKSTMLPVGIPMVYTEKNSIDKNSIDKNSIDKERKKERKKVSYDDVLAKSNLSDTLIQSLKDFIQMRQLIKKPMTNRALELCINDLKKLSDDEETQVKIIEQSIKRNWQGLYPLKEDEKSNGNSFLNL